MNIRLFPGKKAGPEWLVVFLGNPGRSYEQTRHNAGYLAGDILSAERHVELSREKFRGLYGLTVIGGKKVCLLKPTTYMNLSGESVRAAADFYKIGPERIIVVLDDINLEPGRLRVRPNGSSGGHKGLQSIIDHMRTDAVARVRIGVGKPDTPGFDIADWVLSRMTRSELERLHPALEKAGKAVEEIIRSGVPAAMEIFNRAE